MLSVLTTAAAIALLAGLLVHPCASGGGMGGWYKDCACKGTEWVVSDRTAADGPRRTVCFGWVTARKCYRFQGGPEVPCADVPR